MKKTMLLCSLFSVASMLAVTDPGTFTSPINLPPMGIPGHAAVGGYNNDFLEVLLRGGALIVVAGVCYKTWEHAIKELTLLDLIGKEVDVRLEIRAKREKLNSLQLELESPVDHDFKKFKQLFWLKEECMVSQGGKIFDYNSEPCKEFTAALNELHETMGRKKLAEMHE